MALAHHLHDHQPEPDEVEHAVTVRHRLDKLYRQVGADHLVGKPVKPVPRTWYDPPKPRTHQRPAHFTSGVERACPPERDE